MKRFFTKQKAEDKRSFFLEDELLVLRQENETLTQQIQSQEGLLRMVAHELRTPLTAAALAVQSQKLGQINNGNEQKLCLLQPFCASLHVYELRYPSH